MSTSNAPPERPDIVAAIRGGENSLGMNDEPDPTTATLEQALFWRNIYTEILTMEEAVLDRIYQLMASQSPEARREVELTNVPVVVAQVERFRARKGIWDALVHVHEDEGGPALAVVSP
jgi:ribosomal protein L20A (L18A)